MDKLAFGTICVLALAVACMATESADESLLKTLLSDDSRGQLRNMVNRLLLEQNDPPIDSVLNTENQPLSSAKRTFCNWIGGCINGKQGGRTKIQKRPFCNGFFGCGNGAGKRSLYSALLDRLRTEPEEKTLSI